MTYVHNNNQAREEYNRLTGKLFIAMDYYEALKNHQPSRYAPTKFDDEIRRCIHETEKGITRLRNQRQEIEEIIDTFNKEIINPTFA